MRRWLESESAYIPAAKAAIRDSQSAQLSFLPNAFKNTKRVHGSLNVKGFRATRASEQGLVSTVPKCRV